MSEATTELPRPLSPQSLTRLSSEARAALRRLTTPKPLLSAGSFALQWVAIVAVAFAIVRTGIWWLYPVAVVFIGARQHSFYLLIHDASHSSLFKSRNVNKSIATWCAVLPMLHSPEMWSFVQWKRMHVRHHSHLCTDKDYYWVFRREMGLTSRPISRWEIFKCSLKYAVMSPLSWRGEKWVMQAKTAEVEAKIPHWKAFFTSFGHDPEMRDERRITWAFTAAALVAITLLGGWKLVLLFWIVPMYTAYPFLLELAENTEHQYHVGHEDMVATTTSITPGILSKLFYTDMNRTIHREHHLLAHVPYYNLPHLHRLLVENKLVPPATRGLGATVLKKHGLEQQLGV